MFLSRFRVRGYKCLEDIDIALTPLHVLIGPSDSGKSSLLEAISALYGRLRTPLTRLFPAVTNPRDRITHGSSAPTIDLAGQWSESRPPDGRSAAAAGFGFSIAVPTSGPNLTILDQWVRPRAGKDPEAGLVRAALAFPHRGHAATSEDRAAKAAFHDVVQKMLLPAPVFRFDPRRLAEPALPDAERGGHLDGDGFGLPALLADIAQRHSLRFAEVQTEFCRLAPQYRAIHIQDEPLAQCKKARARKPIAVAPAGCGLCFETVSGRNIAAREVSPGTLFLLTMLALVRLPEPPTLLLIESPEQGIYPKWLSDVIGPFRQATQWSASQPSTQIIITTHSPPVLSFFQPEEVTLLCRASIEPDGPTIARPLADMEHLRQQMAGGNVRLGKLWKQIEVR